MVEVQRPRYYGRQLEARLHPYCDYSQDMCPACGRIGNIDVRYFPPYHDPSYDDPAYLEWFCDCGYTWLTVTATVLEAPTDAPA